MVPLFHVDPNPEDTVADSGTLVWPCPVPTFTTSLPEPDLGVLCRVFCLGDLSGVLCLGEANCLGDEVGTSPVVSCFGVLPKRGVFEGGSGEGA